jgi:hypothetical protein
LITPFKAAVPEINTPVEISTPFLYQYTPSRIAAIVNISFVVYVLTGVPFNTPLYIL